MSTYEPPLYDAGMAARSLGYHFDRFYDRRREQEVKSRMRS